MSRISSERLRRSVHRIIHGSAARPAEYLETMAIQMTLSKHPNQRSRRYTRTGEPIAQLCVFGDEQHYEEANDLDVISMDLEDLKGLNNKKRCVKKLSRKYDVFLVSESIIQQVSVIMDRNLKKLGKSLVVVTHDESLAQKVEELRVTATNDLKKVLRISVEIGHVDMGSGALTENALWSVQFMVDLMKRNWHHIKSMCLKSSSGLALDIEYNR